MSIQIKKKKKVRQAGFIAICKCALKMSAFEERERSKKIATQFHAGIDKKQTYEESCA